MACALILAHFRTEGKTHRMVLEISSGIICFDEKVSNCYSLDLPQSGDLIGNHEMVMEW